MTARRRRLLATRLRGSIDGDLKAVAEAWRASDRTWVPLVFTREANECMDFWGRFAGKPDSGGFIEFRPTLVPRIGDEDASALNDHIDKMVDAMWIGTDPRVVPDPWRAAGLEPLHPALGTAIGDSINAAEVRTLQGVLDNFAARVARLTRDECAALVVAHTKPPGEWYGEVRYAMEYSRPEWRRLIDRAYEIARPFDHTPLWDVIIDVGLTITVSSTNRGVADATLAGWRAVIPPEPPFARVRLAPRLRPWARATRRG